MTAESKPKSIPDFVSNWAACFAQVLSELGVASASASAAEPAVALPVPAEEAERYIFVRFLAGGSLKGEQMWVAEKPAAVQLARLLLQQPAEPSAELTDDHKDAFPELLRQVAGKAAAAWKAQVGRETAISFNAASEPAFNPFQVSEVVLTGQKFAEIKLRLFLNVDLCSAVATASPPDNHDSEAPSGVVPPPAAAPPGSTGVSPLPANLNLILDVELEATIRFGKREMLLREIFSLMPGAVVELDQLVNEPADLLVAGRLVARGEVVVVDGNFGLRVFEVASPSERAELLQGSQQRHLA